MPCYHPLKAWYSRSVNPSGKRSLEFSPPLPVMTTPDILVPCGDCFGCRLEKSRQWAMRCVHESTLYDKNCFVTLTFSDEWLDPMGSLQKEARNGEVKSERPFTFAKFMKRLRKRFGSGVRYFHCGEYGEDKGRPHHHACLFNFDFDDKYPWCVRGNNTLYRSPSLEELWRFGQSLIGEVTFDSAAYVARYCMKKLKMPRGEKYPDGRIPEFTSMSRRPGIGRGWFDKFKEDVKKTDSVIVNGREVKPAGYYDYLFDLEDPAEISERKERRRERAERRGDNTPDRLWTKETCRIAQLERKERTL